MGAHSTANAASARDALQSVDEILAELDRLSATELAEFEFYARLVARLTSLGCTSAAIWSISADGEPVLTWRSTPEATGPSGTSLESHSAAVAAAIEANQPRILDRTSDGNGASAASVRSIIAPWSPTSIVQGALQVWIADPISSSALAGYLQVLAAVGELVATYLARQELRRLRRQLDRQTQLDQFIRGLHETFDLEQVAYKIANDGRVLLGCDRLSVAFRRGSGYKIIAISGADHIHRRSESVNRLARLCQTVVASSEPLWHHGVTTDSESRPLPPQIAKQLASYLDVSPSASIGVVPLVGWDKRAELAPAHHKPVGALILEQFSGPFDSSTRDLTHAIAEHSRLALTNAQLLNAIPAHRFWLAMSGDGWLSRWALRTLLLVVVLGAIGAALFGIQADVRIKARGELQPAVRHHVFAPHDGIVTAIHVDHGQLVAAGDALLEMRSPDLDLEIQRVAGELETVRKRLAAAQSERLQTRTTDADARLRQRRLTAEEEQLQQQVRDLSDRQNMLAKQQQELTVKSPIAGEVITWNVQQQLASRPLGRGDTLLTVADVDGPWQLELKVPSRRAGRLLAAQTNANEEQKVSFMLATDPGRAWEGSLREIAPRLETDESGDSHILAKVDAPPELADNRTPGTTAFAHITCGRGTLAEAWFHDLYDAARLWLPF